MAAGSVIAAICISEFKKEKAMHNFYKECKEAVNAFNNGASKDQVSLNMDYIILKYCAYEELRKKALELKESLLRK